MYLSNEFVYNSLTGRLVLLYAVYRKNVKTRGVQVEKNFEEGMFSE